MRSRVAGGAALLVLVLLAAWGIAAAQARSRATLVDGFAARAEIASRFVSTYVGQLLDREAVLAERTLPEPEPSEGAFTSLVEAFGFQAAVLLDGDGRVLDVAPGNPELIGERLTGRYAHLDAALDGRRAVSEVVPSAAQGVPVVGFATPFESATGRRVLSGAYVVADTPLSAFLRDLSALPGVEAYLVDGGSTVLARNDGALAGTSVLGQHRPELARAVAADAVGRYEDEGGRAWTFATADVDGAGWRLVMSVPSASLLAPVEGAAAVVPWVALVVLAALGLAVVELGARYVEGRHALERSSWLDPLTEAYNRRYLDHRLEAELSAARRHRTPVGVLLVDIDRFKRVNDTYGHGAGDQVLRSVADTLRAVVRTEDLVCRWGGEEFLVLMPRTDGAASAVTAERIRAAVAATDVDLGGGRDAIGVTVSIGCAAGVDEVPSALIALADRALYCAKDAGRDRVETVERPVLRAPSPTGS